MIRKAIRFSLTSTLFLSSILLMAASPAEFGSGIEGAQLLDALKLDGQIFHVQGLEVDARHVWVTSVDHDQRRAYVHEFDRTTGRLIRRLDLTDGARFHPGGIAMSGHSLWIPVSEMRPNSSAVLLEIDTGTLQLRRKIYVADHLGCVAVNGRTLVAGTWDSKMFYVINLDDTAQTKMVPNPSATRYQDIKFDGGRLVASGYLTLWSGAVDWLDWPSMQLRRTLRSGAIGPIRPFGRGGPFTGEGMAIHGRELYVVPEDGPSRLFHFKLDH